MLPPGDHRLGGFDHLRGGLGLLQHGAIIADDR